jgi:hypothetical protein
MPSIGAQAGAHCESDLRERGRQERQKIRIVLDEEN